MTGPNTQVGIEPPDAWTLPGKLVRRHLRDEPAALVDVALSESGTSPA